LGLHLPGLPSLEELAMNVVSSSTIVVAIVAGAGIERRDRY
jgi:hypothetical protein